MLKRLFSAASDIEKIFEECKVDKTHEMCHPKRIVDLAQRYFIEENRQNNHMNINISLANVVSKEINISINPNHSKKPSKQEELTRLLIKKIGSESQVLRIKALVVAHSILKKTQHSEFISALLDQVEKYIVEEECKSGKKGEEIEVGLENGRSEFIQRNIISFYCQYLKKYLLSLQSVLFVSQVVNTGKIEGLDMVQVINNGFVMLNLVNYILRSQYTFNKMGRYYLGHKQVLNLYIMYLNDIAIYNDYIKIVAACSVKNLPMASKDLLAHHFLFITQAQKTNDRLYEFFYNRYYYKEVRTLIEMPEFLTIHMDDFKKLISLVRKRDKELVVLVKRSKYDSSSRSKSCATRTVQTEGDLNESSELNKSECLDRSAFFEKEDRRRRQSQVQSAKKTRQGKRSLSEYKC